MFSTCPDTINNGCDAQTGGNLTSLASTTFFHARTCNHPKLEARSRHNQLIKKLGNFAMMLQLTDIDPDL
jgi:hypothetical protein